MYIIQCMYITHCEKKIFFFGSNKFEKIINRDRGGWSTGCVKKIKKLISRGHLLEPLEYKLQDEKVANCEKLYCC